MIRNIILIILAIILLFVVLNLAYRIIVYPELFFSTWRYQLKNDIARGNEEAITYYQVKYLDNGIKLWE